MTHGDVLVAGESLIDFVPESGGPLSSIESFHRRAGGAPANVAVALARTGPPPLFWTRIATDEFGEHLLERLRTADVPEAYVLRDPDAKTGLGFLAGPQDDRSFTFYRENTADCRLQQGAVEDSTLADCSWVHLGGIALASEPSRSAILDLAERARTQDCTVSVDPNVRPEAWTSTAELRTVLGWLIEEADLVFATPSELRTLGYEGDDGLALAEATTEGSPHTTIVTLGETGAVGVATAESPWSGTVRQDGFDLEAVDPTGAGDAFAAGVIRALVDGLSFADAIEFGTAAGALATTRRGGIDATPTRSAIEDVLAQ